MKNDKIIDFLKKEKNLGGNTAFNTKTPQDIMVKIRRDDSVSPANFKPDPLIPGGFVANELTIRAINPEIFTAGEESNLLELKHECSRCSATFDLQFWKICPYCGKNY